LHDRDLRHDAPLSPDGKRPAPPDQARRPGLLPCRAPRNHDPAVVRGHHGGTCPMNRDRVAQLLSAFPDKRILVIGDLMLDEFLWGKVSRISPEAPVPVVEVVKEEYFPGGAANVARNLAEFSKNVRMMGVTGECTHAERLKGLLTSEGINVDTVQSH